MKKKFIAALFLSILTMQSCNVTRVISTEARSYQNGDTAVHIVTKTTETYDATKKTF